MRTVIQRVSEASVSVDGQTVGRIGAGLCILLGVGKDDNSKTAAALADKVKNLRIFDDEFGKMNRSVVDCGGAILVVSQFTLYADCRKGNRPSFTDAAPPALAQELYQGIRQSSARCRPKRRHRPISSPYESGSGQRRAGDLGVGKLTMQVVLFEPEIPPNTGSVARLCAATLTPLHLIEPLGFKIDDKHLKRAGLDYWPFVDLHVHKDWQQFLDQSETGKTALFHQEGGTVLYVYLLSGR